MTAASTDKGANSRMVRLPKTSRESMSRPRLSVPNGYLAEGPVLIALESWASGLWGAITGAKMATRIQKTTIVRPIIATREPRITEKVSHRRRPALARLVLLMLSGTMAPPYEYRMRGLRNV